MEARQLRRFGWAAHRDRQPLFWVHGWSGLELRGDSRMSMASMLALACGMFVAYLNGANDVSKGIATLAGSGVTNYKRAILWGAAWTGMGGLASSVFSQAMVGTFGTGLLSVGSKPTLDGALAALLGAAACVGVATWLGLPVSTTHAIVGSVAGVYSYSLGFAGVNWGAMGGKIVLPLLVSPFLALILVLAILRTERFVAEHIGKAPECLCVDAEPSAVPVGLVIDGGSMAVALAAIPQSGMNISVGTQAACATDRPFAFRITSTQLHWFTSGATSFARGLNDTPKIAALVLVTAALSTGTRLGSTMAFGVVALGMVAGSWMAGKKVTKMLAEKVTPMNHREGFIANLVTAGLVGPGAAFGLPMSTTHVSSGAIIGAGVPKKTALNWKTIQSMVLAWILTVPLAAGLGVSAFMLLRLIYAN
jgi:inorganic phosphate transporter, PiT family